MKRLIFAILLFTIAPSAAKACASCGCTLSSNWEDTTRLGLKLDLRYDFIDQDQLRHGTSTISGSAASQRVNNGNPQEVESYTKNNYITANAEYSVTEDWKIALLIPYIKRDHSTLGTASDGNTPGPGGGQYTSSTSNLGDVKLLGRYQGFTPQHNFGVLFGLKLPTGSHTLTGDSTDPTAPGEVPIDRGLQPGSGTTDIILGAYYSQALDKNWDYFEEALIQYALNTIDQYRPGDGYNFNFGFRFMGYQSFAPQLQVNARFVHHDTGAESDTISTGGTLLYLSPGVTVPVGTGAQVYAFFQVPIYQNLLGVQLAPTYTVSLGARYIF